VLPGCVHQSCGQFPQAATQRIPILLEHDDAAGVIECDDRDSAIVVDNLTYRGTAAGHGDGVAADRDQAAGEVFDGGDGGETAIVGPVVVGAAIEPVGSAFGTARAAVVGPVLAGRFLGGAAS